MNPQIDANKTLSAIKLNTGLLFKMAERIHTDDRDWLISIANAINLGADVLHKLASK
jgi:hypothetical protein